MAYMYVHMSARLYISVIINDLLSINNHVVPKKERENVMKHERHLNKIEMLFSYPM